MFHGTVCVVFHHELILSTLLIDWCWLKLQKWRVVERTQTFDWLNRKHYILQLLFFCRFEKKMATAAGLTSPGLVSLVKRAQKLREEMDEKPQKLIAMDSNSLPRKNGKWHIHTFLKVIICWEVAWLFLGNIPI